MSKRISIAPRMMTREETAGYLGISVNSLDALVASGEILPPIQWSLKSVRFDRRALDERIDRLQGIKPLIAVLEDAAKSGQNPWDDLLGGG